MNQNKIAAIVVTYNRCKLLIECIDALKLQEYRAFDIIVVDNASTDETQQNLSTYISNGEIRYFNTGENLGGAGGFNYGIRKAFEAGYQYFWLMDDDTIPFPSALLELVKAAERLNNQFGYLVSKALWTDSSLCKMNIPVFSNHDVHITKESLECLEIKRATFVSFFLTRTTVCVVGLPIKEFFIWADDTNYCLRINKLIGKGFWIGSSIVFHKMAVNQGPDIVKSSWDRLDRFIYAYRNRYYNSRMLKKRWKIYLSVVKTMGRIVLFSKDHKILRIQYMLRGIHQGWHFNPGIEYADR